MITGILVALHSFNHITGSFGVQNQGLACADVHVRAAFIAGQQAVQALLTGRCFAVQFVQDIIVLRIMAVGIMHRFGIIAVLFRESETFRIINGMVRILARGQKDIVRHFQTSVLSLMRVQLGSFLHICLEGDHNERVGDAWLCAGIGFERTTQFDCDSCFGSSVRILDLGIVVRSADQVSGTEN